MTARENPEDHTAFYALVVVIVVFSVFPFYYATHHLLRDRDRAFH